LVEWSIKAKPDLKYPDLYYIRYVMGKKYPGVKAVGFFLIGKTSSLQTCKVLITGVVEPHFEQ